MFVATLCLEAHTPSGSERRESSPDPIHTPYAGTEARRFLRSPNCGEPELNRAA
jgi:hypothetical protein